MAEGSSLENHIDELNKVNDTLEIIDEGLDDEGKALLLMSSLPSSYLNFVDALMRVWVYVLKHKDQVFGKFREWKSLIENQTGLKVKKLRADNGLEFCNHEFDSYCADHGIARHRTVRLTPQQNGLAEKMNRTLMDKVKSMLIQSQFPKGLWAEILLTTSYLVNLSPSVALDFKTPFKKWHGKPVNYDSLKVFGCPAYAHVSQGKSAPRALKGKLIWYPEDLIAYALTASHQIDDDKPKNYKEAIQGLYKDEWKMAMDKEISSLKKNNTWELVKRPANSRTIRCKWIYRVKDGLTTTEPKRFKARVLLTLTDVKDIKLDQLDVKTTFLHVRLHEDILMTHHEGYINPESVDCVCLLNKSLYGLKQSPKQWYLRFNEFMVTHGYLRTDEEKGEMTKVPYVNAIGCMMYAMVLTRPDLAHALSVVSRFMATPGKEHWKAVKWVLRYLKDTQWYGLVYGKSAGNDARLCGYVDSDFAGDLDRRRSLTGYLFFLDGCLINWKASLQYVVALSTTEVKYIDATEAVRESLWLRGLIA
ncbi:hypothetical protein KPL71_001741 [Citrus sinensis]|uniref:Uncharacterized protein n=1 Tax=Citrus sinensis TaxID=2711 RepID=A0ACB8NZY6_CITSI|nr:hypothetical protein KPL71_001741 [Citrus sinensis]